MLRETEFAYAPNEALACPRHPFFDPDTPAEASPAATQQENETASTPSSITGVNLAGALSISAASPLLEQEVSFATYSSSSRLSSQSALRQSPVNCATPPEHIILSLQAEQAPADIVNAPAVASTDAHGMLAEATNTVAASSFMTPPSGVISKNGPQGPVTRSKSARKVNVFEAGCSEHRTIRAGPVHLCLHNM